MAFQREGVGWLLLALCIVGAVAVQHGHTDGLPIDPAGQLSVAAGVQEVSSLSTGEAAEALHSLPAVHSSISGSPLGDVWLRADDMAAAERPVVPRLVASLMDAAAPAGAGAGGAMLLEVAATSRATSRMTMQSGICATGGTNLLSGGTTCCGGQLCPFADGVCCENGRNCCPSNSFCVPGRHGASMSCASYPTRYYHLPPTFSCSNVCSDRLPCPLPECANNPSGHCCTSYNAPPRQVVTQNVYGCLCSGAGVLPPCCGQRVGQPGPAGGNVIVPMNSGPPDITVVVDGVPTPAPVVLPTPPPTPAPSSTTAQLVAAAATSFLNNNNNGGGGSSASSLSLSLPASASGNGALSSLVAAVTQQQQSTSALPSADQIKDMIHRAIRGARGGDDDDDDDDDKLEPQQQQQQQQQKPAAAPKKKESDTNSDDEVDADSDD